MIRCTQPGCSGQIEDGYCNVCGMAAPPAPPGTSSPAVGADPEVDPAASRPTRNGRATPGSAPAGAGSTRTVGSNRLSSAPIGSARTGASRPTRSLHSTSTRLRAARLGAGLTTIPSEPAVDPRSAVLANPEVAEEKRFCPSCGAPVGRTRGDRPGRTEGFCPKCRSPFSFAPKLVADDVVGGQYEVVGCLAHGGLGWIYLARDRNVSDRWVVLKGLLNAGDADAFAAAIAERQFLAEVEHPLIVEIYNFVMHDGAGYIVMEYVGGKSLKAILKDRLRANGGVYDPIPVDQAIAYIIEILPAFQFLHDTGLLYCDFKPDNMIQSGDSVKLIDLGGVRRVDDADSAIYGTVGYQAPEVADIGPSIPSEIYTVGRTLAVLAMEFRGYQTTYGAQLPPVADTPLFQQYDSLYRLLVKACAPEPADRFQSAEELRVQLLGVLREIMALRRTRGAAAHSTSSPLFDPPVVAGDTLEWHQLPALRADEGDAMAAWLASVSIDDPVQRRVMLDAAPEATIEVRLAAVRAAIDSQQFDDAERRAAQILVDDPWEWRAVWLTGLAALARGDADGAEGAFNTVYGQVPGELAPKLALALACERSGEPEFAESLYLTCVRTDANYAAPAAFGLARIRGARGDDAGSLAALDLVPPTSRAFVEARRRRASLLMRSGSDLSALSDALGSIEAISINPRDRSALTIEVLAAALDTVKKQGPQPKVRIGGIPAEERPLRDGLEGAYRSLADLVDDDHERVRLVDAANRTRRWTLT